MKIFSHILSFEFNSIIRKKTWYVTTIIISLVIIIGTSIPTIMAFFDKDDDKTPKDAKSICVFINTDDLSSSELSQFIGAKIKEVDNSQTLKDGVIEGKYKYGVEINSLSSYKLYFKDKSLSNFSQTKVVGIALNNIKKKNYIESKNLDYDEFFELENQKITREEIVLGTDGVNNFPITYLLIFIIYFLVLFYGQMVSMSVAKEKSDRTMELLITSTTPTKLMYGKVIGGGLAGLLQFSIFGFIAVLSFMANKAAYPDQVTKMITFTPKLFGLFLLFILLGYLLYLFIFAMLGATVSKLEELNQAVMPITIIMIISFIATTSSMQFPDSMVLKIASYIPFSAPLAMFTRVSLYSVSNIELIISIVILVVTTILFGFIATKIYRSATLNYGNKMKLSNVFKLIFRKE